MIVHPEEGNTFLARKKPNRTAKGTILKGSAPSCEKLDNAMGLHRRSRYARDLVWDTNNREHSRTPLASATESTAPLPPVPRNKLCNLAALRLIALQHDLFKAITPINIDQLSKLLKTHPNCPFVNSVCQGLCNGFWPYSNTSDPKYPTTWDNSTCPIHNPAHVVFLSEQHDKEVCLRRW